MLLSNIYRDEDEKEKEKEKEKTSFFFSSSDTTITATEGGGDDAAGQLERTGYDTDTATNAVATEGGEGLGRRVPRQNPGDGGVDQDGARRRRLVGRGASGRCRSAVTQQSTRGGVRLHMLLTVSLSGPALGQG